MSLFSWVQDQIKESYEYLKDDYSMWLMEQLLEPMNIVEADLTITLDSGEEKTYKAYRSQHSDVRWPYKGWIRYHQDVSLDEVKSLSAWMSFKCATVGIPLWWGKWWIIVNPKELSQTELERLSREYIKAIYTHIWPTKDVPAPDVNTNSTIMWWMADEYAKQTWSRKPGVITWKPLTIWWSAWRGQATSRGWLFVLQRYLTNSKDHLAGKKIIIQWAGNAGLNFALLASQAWAHIIWISDSKWAIIDEGGFDMDQIIELKSQRKSVIDYISPTTNDQTPLDITNNQDLLTHPCDILVPAALENQLTKENADKIQASIILELANGPTTPDADTILDERWITVIPDILANAWWVTVSYFEQVQNNTNYYWTETEVNEKLLVIMEQATDWVMETAQKNTTSLRDSAYIISLEKILAAMKARGR